MNAIKIFNEKMVDELILLDITAHKQNRAPDYDFLRLLCSEAYMPIAFGGGVSTAGEAVDLVRIGFEKVVLRGLLFRRPSEVVEMTKVLGSQAVVASLDFELHPRRGFELLKRANLPRLSVQQAISNSESLGVGELMLTSVGREGSRSGIDLDLLELGRMHSRRPLIIHGGASGPKDIDNSFDRGADAVAAGSLFVFSGNGRSVLLNYPRWEDRVLRETN